jgi:hypothetical protein
LASGLRNHSLFFRFSAEEKKRTPTLRVHLYADGATPLRTEDLEVPTIGEARSWADACIGSSRSLRRAQIYGDGRLLSEVGYRVSLLG